MSIHNNQCNQPVTPGPGGQGEHSVVVVGAAACHAGSGEFAQAFFPCAATTTGRGP